MSITTLIDRLDGVRQTGPGRWIARCPGPLHAHGDRHPSLSIREAADGKLLVRCFTGCNTGDVLAAAGLTWPALFPEPLEATRRLGGGYSDSPSRIPPADLLAIISEDVCTVAIIAAALVENRAISEDDWNRLARAAARIGRARDHVR